MASPTHVYILTLWVLVCLLHLAILFKWQTCNATESPRQIQQYMPVHGDSSAKQRIYQKKCVKVVEPLAKQRSVYDERRRTMMESCKKNGYHGHKLKTADRNHFSMDRKDGLLYCDIPRVASTSWKRVLQIASGKRNVGDVFHIPAQAAHTNLLETFQGKDFDEIHEDLFSHTKFMFVREPYSRIFSGFIDKIFTPRPGFASLRARIKALAGKITGDKQKDQCSIDVTFTDTVRFFSQAILDGTCRDPNFVLMYDLCRPCAVQFDIIGKMETFKEDAKYIFESSDFSKSIKMDDIKSDFDSIRDIAESTFAERAGIEKCLPFGQALKLVWKKAVIRGILSREEELPKRFLNSSNCTKFEFRKAMLGAYLRSLKNQKRLQNRKEALKEAIFSLPKDVLENYRNLFRPDFEIFGYDIDNPEIFSGTRPKPFYLVD